MYHKTHVKVAPVGLGAKAALVTIQELLPVLGIIDFEEADVLLLLRRHDGGSGIALNGRGRDGDGRIGLGLSSRRCAERSLPSRRLGRRSGADGGRRKEQVDDCGVEPHFFFVALIAIVDSSVFRFSANKGSQCILCARYISSLRLQDMCSHFFSRGCGNPWLSLWARR